MRRFTYIDCPICGKEFQSLGYASHRAMHRREREQAKKSRQPRVIKSVCPVNLLPVEGKCKYRLKDKMECRMCNY